MVKSYVEIGNRWGYSCAKADMTVTLDDNSTITIPKGAVYNPWNPKAGPAKITAFYADYSETDAIAYSVLDEGNAYESGWLPGTYIYASPADAAADKRIVTGKKWSTTPVSVTIYTDDYQASTYSCEISFTGDYSTVTLKVADFVKSGKDTYKKDKDGKDTTTVDKAGKTFDAKKVTGIRIDTNKTAGDIYIKAMTVTTK